MKNAKYLGLILTICMLSLALLFVSCNTNDNNDGGTQSPTSEPTSTPTEPQPTEPEPVNIEYTLEFVNYKNEPMDDISGMLTLDNGDMHIISKGKASFIALKGNYKATFALNDDSYVTFEEFEFTAKHPHKILPLYNDVKGEFDEFYASENGASFIGVGATYVKLNGVPAEDYGFEYDGLRSYFLFSPDEPGVYTARILPKAGENTTIGCYGGSVLNIFNHTIYTVNDNVMTFDVLKGSISADGTTTIVIGITADETVEDSIILIERTGDLPLSFSDLEWEKPTVGKLEKQLLSYKNRKVTLQNLNLHDESLNIVYNETDGYYHLGAEDGPIIYIRLSAPIDYFGYAEGETAMPAFSAMFDGSPFAAYYKDENGQPLRKELYNDALNAYVDMTDELGVYPLDKLLEYMIKEHGNYHGWWDFESDGNIYRFYGDTNYPPVENAWLFAACTLVYEEDGVSEDKTIVVNSNGGTSLIESENVQYFYKANEKSSFELTLTVTAVGGENIYVMYNGVKTNATDGTVTIDINGSTVFSVGIEGLAEGEKALYTISYTVKE